MMYPPPENNVPPSLSNNNAALFALEDDDVFHNYTNYLLSSRESFSLSEFFGVQESNVEVNQNLNILSPLNEESTSVPELLDEQEIHAEAAQTLNSLAIGNGNSMDHSLSTSPDVNCYQKTTFLTRDNLLNTSKPEVLYEDVNQIYSHEDGYLKDSVEAVKYLPEVGPIGDIDFDIINDDLTNGTQTFETPIPQPTTNSHHQMQVVDLVASDSKHRIEVNYSEPIAATDRVQTLDNLVNVALMKNAAILERILLDSVMDVDRRVFPENDYFWRDSLPPLSDYEDIQNDMMFSRKRKPQLSNYSSSSHRPLQVPPASMDRHFGPSETKIQATKDFTQSSVQIAGEDLYQSLPKRHKSNITKEGGACKNCHCKKSKCLQLYCACFAAGVYCTGPCSCEGCQNNPDNKDRVQEARAKIKSHDPLAFAPKRLRKGCNCRESSCKNNYCECFKAGVGCSISCNCRGCNNIHGCKNKETEAHALTPQGKKQRLLVSQKQELGESSGSGSQSEFESGSRNLTSPSPPPSPFLNPHP